MKKLIMMICALCMFPVFFGCTTLPQGPPDSYYLFIGVCRHKALYAASIVGEKYPVRIIAGTSIGRDTRHAQAQAFIDGEWKWLSIDTNGEVRISTKDFFIPDSECDPVDYLKSRVLLNP